MRNEPVDVLIIGSSHAGGMAAKVLTERGVECLLLNAGPAASADLSASMLTPPPEGYEQQTSRGMSSIAAQRSDVWVNEREVPYTFNPERPYSWTRVRLMGGRSLFWSRQCFRMSDYEFKAKSRDGFGEDWPITYAELSPFYARVEEIFRVAGRRDHLPQMPDGDLVPVTDTWGESLQHFADAAASMKVPVCHQRRALGREGFASSINLLLPDAQKTGKLTIVNDAVVREISVDKETGLVNGCHYVHRVTGEERHVRARAVVLAAGTLESTRLLLNSGIANSSGLVGHFLTDHMYGPGVVSAVPQNNGFAHGMGGEAIIPRFRNLNGNRATFLRGYAFNVRSLTGAMEERKAAPFGAESVQALAQHAGALFDLSMMGEVLPRRENHVRINKDTVDAWGIPVLHIEATYGENEHAMAKDAVDMACKLVDAAGFQVLATNYTPHLPGQSIHEVGTCRMGDDPKTSVLNKWCQSHDHRNLLVVDGASFTSAGWQNPTLTITALAMRAAEHLADERQKLNL